MSEPTFTQTAKFDVVSKAELGGLDQTLAKLKAIDAQIDKLNAKFSGRVGMRGAEAFRGTMPKGELGVEALAKEFGFDPAGLRAYAIKTDQELRKGLDKLRSTVKAGKASEAALLEAERKLPLTSQRGTTFRNAELAAATMARYEAQAARKYASLFKAATGQTAVAGGPAAPTAAQVAGAQVQATVAGGIALNIPAAQIEAKVVGPITLTIPGAQIAGTATGAAVVAGAKPGKHIAEQFEHPAITAATTPTAPAKTKTPTGSGSGRKSDVVHMLALEKEELKRQLAAAATDLNARSVALAKGAQQMRAVMQSPAAQDLDDEVFQRLNERVQAGARTLEAKSRSVLGASRLRSVDHASRAQDQMLAEAAALNAAQAQEFRELQKSARQSAAQTRKVQNLWNRQSGIMGLGTTPPVLGSGGGGLPPILPPMGRGGPPAGGPGGFRGFMGNLWGEDGRLVTKGLKGFTPSGFTKNVLTVGGWTAAVSALYAGIGVVQQSVQSFVELERATKRLDQVFRGGGGSAKQLADDVLALASANGRASKEAMDAAIAWSRTGMNRVEVNEAVKASLMAANVAEMEAGEATEALSAVMAGYSLNARDLEGVLGQVNHTSNTLRVTNKDLFQGLERTAAIARQAKLPLEQLIPILGTAVAATGNTGNQFGNAMKTVLTRLGTPEIQSYLREQLGIETVTAGGQMRSASDILGDLAASYKSMPSAQRAEMVATIGRATQANRLVTFLEQWDRSMAQANDNSKNLDSALRENQKITSSIDARWKGIITAWDRIIHTGGYGPASLVSQQLERIGVTMNAVADFEDLTLNSPAAAVFGKFAQTASGMKPAWLGLVSQVAGSVMGSTFIGDALRSKWGLDRVLAQASKVREPDDVYRAVESEEFSRLQLDQLAQGRNMFRIGGAADAMRLEMAMAGETGGLDLPDEVRARFRALQDPRLLDMARLTDRRGIARAATLQEIAGFGFGSTPGEQLLNRREGIETELAALAGDRELSDNEIVRQLTLQIELLNTQESIQQRIAQVEAERRQIQIDSSREFQKSLLTAGPQELLRKLAVSEMWRGGRIGAHNFFAMGTESRADADLLMGGEAMRQNRFDAGLLGPAWSVGERQVGFQDMGDQINATRERLAQGESSLMASLAVAESVSASMDRLGAATLAAGQQMEALAESTGWVAEVFKGAVDWITGKADAPPQTSGAAPGARRMPRYVGAY